MSQESPTVKGLDTSRSLDHDRSAERGPTGRMAVARVLKALNTRTIDRRQPYLNQIFSPAAVPFVDVGGAFLPRVRPLAERDGSVNLGLRRRTLQLAGDEVASSSTLNDIEKDFAKHFFAEQQQKHRGNVMLLGHDFTYYPFARDDEEIARATQKVAERAAKEGFKQLTPHRMERDLEDGVMQVTYTLDNDPNPLSNRLGSQYFTPEHTVSLTLLPGEPVPVVFGRTARLPNSHFTDAATFHMLVDGNGAAIKRAEINKVAQVEITGADIEEVQIGKFSTVTIEDASLYDVKITGHASSLVLEDSKVIHLESAEDNVAINTTNSDVSYCSIANNTQLTSEDTDMGDLQMGVGAKAEIEGDLFTGTINNAELVHNGEVVSGQVQIEGTVAYYHQVGKVIVGETADERADRGIQAIILDYLHTEGENRGDTNR